MDFINLLYKIDLQLLLQHLEAAALFTSAK